MKASILTLVLLVAASSAMASNTNSEVSSIVGSGAVVGSFSTANSHGNHSSTQGANSTATNTSSVSANPRGRHNGVTTTATSTGSDKATTYGHGHGNSDAFAGQAGVAGIVVYTNSGNYQGGN